MQLQKYCLDTRLTAYIPLPRSILDLSLPATAVLLYGVLLDRATLSGKNGYADPGGWVYVVYPLEELSERLHCSTRMLKRHILALERAGLLRKLRLFRKLANQYYLYVPADAVTGTGRGQPWPSGGTNPASGRGHPGPPNNRKKQHNRIDLYQHDEEESL